MSDVKQAAERLRRAKTDGESSVYFYADPQFFADRSTIIDAYLAEHAADDDEPIDAKRRTRWKVADNFYVYACGADVWLEDEVDLRLIELPMVKTLLQLRLLLRALNPERGQP